MRAQHVIGGVQIPEDSTASQSAIIAFLRAAGLVAENEAPRLTALTGGVASDIWKVETHEQTFAVKRALPRLRVAQEWTAPVSRNASEVDWMITAGAVAPNAVPRILAHEQRVGAFAMEFLEPGRFPVWKAELAAGRVDPAFAAKVGAVIASIHAATARSESVAERFANDAVFHSIRLEPYLEATARVHADLAPILMELSRATIAAKIALVHGDVSPKNILVGPVGPVFLDAECAWFGDPAFDLAFCLNHMHLKSVLVPTAAERLKESHQALASTYLAHVNWEPAAEIERRTARLLPALLLARIDGKSPVEYIVAEHEKSHVRQIARKLITSPVATLAEIRAAWKVPHG